MLERGEVANTWKTERWDSLRLLTPNWLTRLPGLAYDGEDPDGFMAVPELIEFLERYAEHVDAPVRTQHHRHVGVAPAREGYLVETDDGSWEATAVVVASGAFNQPRVPAVSASLPPALDQVTPLDYKRPDQLRAWPGAGRGRLGHRHPDRRRAAALRARGDRRRRRARPHAADLPGPRHHVVARADRPARRALRRGRRPGARPARPLPAARRNARRADLDLNALTARGATLVGRLGAVNGSTASFSGSLRNVCNLADLKLNRLLDTIDQWAGADGGPAPEPTRVDDRPRP